MLTNRLSGESQRAQRRWASEQALASARIEGHIPTPAYLADCEAVVQGVMTLNEAGARSLARAVAADKYAAELKTTGLQTKNAR